jgi:hypothetical protein
MNMMVDLQILAVWDVRPEWGWIVCVKYLEMCNDILGVSLSLLV